MEVNFNTILEDGSTDELGELLVRKQNKIFYHFISLPSSLFSVFSLMISRTSLTSNNMPVL